MTPKKSAGQASSRSTTATTVLTTSAEPAARKPWKKKTPVEVMLDQIGRLRMDVDKKEQDLKQAKRQMEKLEEARKLLESD